MADRWLVRVGEKEYGPVDLDTLGDWKREGRLLPTNEVRREAESDLDPGDYHSGAVRPATAASDDRASIGAAAHL